MNSKKISVVIPVYNSAAQLNTTLDSLFCQTMPARDFEIICVNDASTDDSKAVIERRKAAMPNLKLIDLPKNTGGPMLPRNTGIEAAKGRYIHFVDSDDFLGEEALERLYNAAEAHNSDVIFGRYISVNGRVVPKSMFRNGNIPGANLSTHSLVHSLGPCKMVRRSFLNAYGIRFYTAKKTVNEDHWFVMQCYIKAKVTTVLSDYDYYFVVGRGLQSFSKQTSAAEDYFCIPRQIMAFVDEQVVDPVLSRKLKMVYVNQLLRYERLPKHLLDLHFPIDEKKEWLAEGKKFLNTNLDHEMAKMLHADNANLVRLIQSNNLKGIEMLAEQKRQVRSAGYKPQRIATAVAKGTVLLLYSRPSENSALSDVFTQPGKSLQVFSSINGWWELRLPDNEGNVSAAFVKQDAVLVAFEFRLHGLFKQMKALLKRSWKPQKAIWF